MTSFKPQQSRPKTSIRLNFDDYDSPTKINPYQMPEDNEYFRIRDKQLKDKQKELKVFSKKPLMVRNCPSALPTLRAHSKNSVSKRNTNSTSSNMNNDQYNGEYGGIQPVGPEYQCKEELHDFVDQKREIFLVQLLIDRKKKEIERISQQENAEDAVFKDQTNKIAETKNQYKMTINQLEAELQRQRKIADQAIKQRAEAAANLKIKKAQLLAIENEIGLNEESAKQYRKYKEFIQGVEAEFDRVTIFKNPKLILEVLEYLENENLFLFEKCAELSNDRDTIVGSISSQIEHAVNESENMVNMSMNLKQIPLIDAHSNALNTPEVKQLDQDLGSLGVIVDSAYEECFGKPADISPLMMLERIENELETMYKESEAIPEKEIIEKQNAKDKERREKQRIEKQMAQILEQQAKNDAAIQRSKMPIKKRNGRPLYERNIPRKINRHVNKKNLDDVLQEKLLFGEIND